ncbi:hypothetical protein F5Y06DRAFT_306235 [Hypoxylon sp. FL0890]|nr:hypothetical protein F5Y06DRAFT_306235 [Hypoxylon sp. FL0890]
MRFLECLPALSLFILSYTIESDASTATDDNPDALPAISPPYDFDGAIEPDLLQHLNSTRNELLFFPTGMMPEYCMNVAKDNGYGPADIEAFNIFYSDCALPWTVCRLNHSKVDAYTMAEFFGKIPLSMREFIRHIIVLKPKDLQGAAAASNDDNIEFSEDSWCLYILVHEISHSLDSHVFIPGVTQPDQDRLSDSQTWKDQFSQDSATVSEYARTLWTEDLAETGIIALYDIVVPGGADTLSKNSHDVYHQYSTYQKYYGDLITPGKKTNCTSRLMNSQMVIWDGSGYRDAGEDRPKPNTRITIIPPSVFHNETCVLPRVK